MWQRIQTVFLALLALSLLGSILFPVWVFDAPDGKGHRLYAMHYMVIENGQRTVQYFPYSMTAMFSVASITLAIIAIGKYKNRLLQLKLGALNSLFLVGVMGSAVYFAGQFIDTMQGGHYGFGLYLPGVAVILNLLSNRFIRRDEKLVRDTDRLR